MVDVVPNPEELMRVLRAAPEPHVPPHPERA
jgi:hypothetical protein